MQEHVVGGAVAVPMPGVDGRGSWGVLVRKVASELYEAFKTHDIL